MPPSLTAGNHTRSGIASFLERKSTDLGHALTVLEVSGLVRRDPDAFHAKRAAYRIAEPYIAFHHAVMRPRWSDLEGRGYAQHAWDNAQTTFRSKVLGPHFEEMCRTWTRWYADTETLGGFRSRVSSGTVADPGHKSRREVDVVFGTQDTEGERVLALGEAKWQEIMGISHLERLHHIRGLVPNAERAHALLFSGAGFTDELRDIASRDPGVQLVGLERLYHGA